MINHTSMGNFESFGQRPKKPRLEANDRRSLRSESTFNPASVTLRDFANMHARFGSIDAQFDALPQTNEDARHKPGEQVIFPGPENSNGELLRWQVVRAEKGHYLLERKTGDNKFDHVLCSEDELTEYNSR